MENFLSILVVLNLCVAEPVERLNAFSFAALAQLMHKEIRTTQSHNDDKQPITDAQVKERLCHSVTSSGILFNPSKYERVYMYEIYEELKNEYGNIFNELYVEPTNPSILPPGRDKVYANATKEIATFNPWSKGLFLEHLFVCLIRLTNTSSSRDTRKLEKIYVSGEYDVRDRQNAVGPYKAGRFIFRYSEDYKSITPYGFVEEPATVLAASISYLEDLYIQRVEQFKSDRKKCPQYLRELNGFEMSRICGIVLNSEHFNGKHKYLEYVPNYIEDRCLCMNVSFETFSIRTKTFGKFYREWTLRCKVLEISGNSFWYHISRADGSLAEVFVFRETGDYEIRLENLSADVRFAVPF